MKTTTWTLISLIGLVALCQVGFSSPIVKRQVLQNPESLDPVHQNLDSQDEADRGKRKIEGVVELTYGAKNAILGIVFNKINSFIDQKTAWVNQLDQLNVAKNRQYGIEAPADPITSFGNVFGSPLHYPAKFIHDKLFKPRFKRAIGVTPRPKTPTPTTTEDYVTFTPGERVSLKVPDQLFGSGFGLVTNISQIVGSVIQNSAERTAKVFEAMKPFLQSVFGVKSLTITRDGPANNKI